MNPNPNLVVAEYDGAREEDNELAREDELIGQSTNL